MKPTFGDRFASSQPVRALGSEGFEGVGVFLVYVRYIFGFSVLLQKESIRFPKFSDRQLR